MDTHPQFPVKYCDVLGGKLIVTFKDGAAAIYSAELLRSIFDQAEPLPPDEDDAD